MLLTGARSYLHVFFILAFIFAGVSPACKFISGQFDFIEICGFDGIKTVAVDQSQNPDQPDHTKMAQNDCAFCFNHTNVKTAAAPAPQIIAPLAQAPDYTLVDVSLMVPVTAAQFDARGPPAFTL
jgi:hypothetical protein